MKTLSKQAIQQDIKELQRKLEEIHPNPYKYIAKSHFQALLNTNIENICNLRNFGFKIMSTLPLLRDGHTHLCPSDDILGTDTFMFRLKCFNKAYYLTKCSHILSPYLGAKLLGINNFSIDELEEKLKIFIPQENETSTQFYLPSKIIEPKILEFIGVENEKQITLHLEINGENLSIEIQPEDYKNKKMVSLESKMKDIPPTFKRSPNYWYTELKTLSALYFQYNDCEEREDLKIENVVDEIKKLNLKILIVDLRNNRGGDSDILKPLVTYLKNPRSELKIFILTGLDTYSSGIINLVELSNLPNSISIGEIPHGNPTHYGYVKSFVLTNSKLKIFTSSTIFRFKGYRLGEIFRPTHTVNTQIEDLLNGRDTQMEYLKGIL